VRFEVLTVEFMKIKYFWYVRPPYLYIISDASNDNSVSVFRVKQSKNRICFLCRRLEKSKYWLLAGVG